MTNPENTENRTESSSDGPTDSSGYSVLAPADIDPTAEYPCDRRSIADATDFSILSAAFYELAPGEQLPRTYHSHDQREEVFYVQEGRLHVETPETEYEVEAGSVFVVRPGNPHLAFNPDEATETVTVLGVGAPRYDVAKPYEGESNSGNPP